MVTTYRECIYILFFIMQEMRHNIAGPLCFSGDVIKRDVLLPMVIEAFSARTVQFCSSLVENYDCHY